MPHHIGIMRENHPSGTSGINHVPALVDEFSMIGVSNKRSAGSVLPPPSGVHNEDKSKPLNERQVPPRHVSNTRLIRGLVELGCK